MRSPDPCEAPPASVGPDEVSDLYALDMAGTLLAKGLQGTERAAAVSHATEILTRVQEASSKALVKWDEASRFSFRVVDLSPALAVQMSLGSHARFLVYSKPPSFGGKPNVLWREVGQDDIWPAQQQVRTWVTLYPLHRGPSGNPRFLASWGISGCAGSYSTQYDLREVRLNRPDDAVEQIVKVEGAAGLDDRNYGEPVSAKQPFPLAGRLGTDGPRITLPNCWFSSLDTWDDPSLCAVDTYDLARDEARFVSRGYNRPDLLPIAKAIEYAEKRDLRALRGYCASLAVARAMLHYAPFGAGADELRVQRTGRGREQVSFGNFTAYRFEVVERGGQWYVTSFHPN